MRGDLCKQSVVMPFWATPIDSLALQHVRAFSRSDTVVDLHYIGMWLLQEWAQRNVCTDGDNQLQTNSCFKTD